MQRSILIGLVCFGVACSGREAPVTSDGGTSEGGTSEVGPISAASFAWTPCDLFSEGGWPKVECSIVKAPLWANDPGGETLDVYVKRVRPRATANRKAVFMLQGGPGASGYAFEKFVDAVLKAGHQDIDWYLPDHRGTGRSSRLTCPVQEAAESSAGGFVTPVEWPACREALKAQWGPKLAAFSTTQAANDVAVMVDLAKKEHEEVFVYGVSYGTYWANRYLQLQPAQAAGVILDSIVIPGASLARQDEDADAAGKLLFEACAKDAVCRTKLGDDPWGKAQAVFAEIAEGHCAAAFLPGLPPRVQLRRAFGQMMMGFDLRSYLPAAVHRLDRCTDDDAVAITKLLGLFFNEEDPGEFFRQYSFSLANNVALSELWETPSPTPAELAKIRNAAIVSRDITEGLAVHIGKWPTYPAEDLFGKLATTDLPLLMMQAPLDPATLYAKALPAKAHWTGPRQHWVEFANGGHSMLGSTPTTANKSCGTAVLLSFVRDPKATPDTSCLASLRPVSFEGTPELSKVVFGRDSAWD